MHKRLTPKINQFSYNIYYLVFPLSNFKTALQSIIKINKLGWLSFYEQDHGMRDGSDLEPWINNILAEHKLDTQVTDVVLVTMPRVLNYVFNPVSFWLCLDTDKQLRAVLSEVNNRHGQTHSYLCANADHSVLNKNQWLSADKLFRVSPFFKRTGSYKFKFDYQANSLGICIDYYDRQQNKQLITSVVGQLSPLTKASLIIASLQCPLVTFKTVYLIHWQALKLLLKGVKLVATPVQLARKISANRELINNRYEKNI